MPAYIPKPSDYCSLCLGECKETANNSSVTIGIGGCRVAKAPCLMKTTLGSCVGITLYAPAKQIGGLIHVMLPNRTRSEGSISKFANTGIPNLINCLINQHGIVRSSLIAKIFGGAKMFNVYSKALDIGNNNINTTLAILKQQGINIRPGKTGGTKGSQILFDTSNGQVMYKTIGGQSEIF